MSDRCPLGFLFIYLFIFILHVGAYMKQQKQELGILFRQLNVQSTSNKHIKTCVGNLPHLTTSVIITVLSETRHAVSTPNYVSYVISL